MAAPSPTLANEVLPRIRPPECRTFSSWPWPYGTLAVNALGGVLMGVLVSWLMLRGGADQERWRLLIGVGVLGGFTTFSAFSLEVALLLQRRAWAEAFGYSLVSVGLSVAALFLGLALMRRVLM